MTDPTRLSPGQPLRLCIEGVAGSGKSSLIQALLQGLQAQHLQPWWISEDETFGELMDELLSGVPANFCWRLEQLLLKLPDQLAEFPTCILERFHPSYYAQVPEASRYQEIDQHLASLGFTLVLLDLPDDALKQRSLLCPEREGWTAGNLAFYGSETVALQAFQTSQQRRRDYLHLTAMPVLTLDSQSMNWQALAKTVLHTLQAT